MWYKKKKKKPQDLIYNDVLETDGSCPKMHCQSHPLYALLRSVNKAIVLFANAKWRKLASHAEWIIMTPIHGLTLPRINVWKQFGFNAMNRNIVD